MVGNESHLNVDLFLMMWNLGTSKTIAKQFPIYSVQVPHATREVLLQHMDITQHTKDASDLEHDTDKKRTIEDNVSPLARKAGENFTWGGGGAWSSKGHKLISSVGLLED